MTAPDLLGRVVDHEQCQCTVLLRAPAYYGDELIKKNQSTAAQAYQAFCTNVQLPREARAIVPMIEVSFAGLSEGGKEIEMGSHIRVAQRSPEIRNGVLTYDARPTWDDTPWQPS